MCKLLVGQTTTPGHPEFAKIIQLQYDDLRSQPDGIGALIVTADNVVHVHRSFADYESVFARVDALLPTAKLVSLHTRISTGGSKNLENVHFFESNNYLLAHNGWVSGKSTTQAIQECHGCQSAKKAVCKRHLKKLDSREIGFQANLLTGSCDTKRFLEEITTAYPVIAEEELAHELTAQIFTGVGFLFNRTSQEAFLFARNRAKNPIQSLTDHKTFAVFFSYQPTTEETYALDTTKLVFGVPVTDSEGEEYEVKTDIPVTIVADGVYRLETKMKAKRKKIVPIPMFTPAASTPTSALPYTFPLSTPHTADVWRTERVDAVRYDAHDTAKGTGVCDLCGEIRLASYLEFDTFLHNTVCKDCTRHMAMAGI